MAPPKRRTPRPIQHRPVLAALKAKPCGRRGAPALTATARRPLQKGHAGMKKRSPPNQETGHLLTKSGHLCLSLTAMAKED